MSDTVISVKSLGIKYKKSGSLVGVTKKQFFWALKNINFEVKKGEVLGIIGVNGAGKSTLLKSLNLILEPDEGEVINHGYTTALISISAGFIPYLTGRENSILNGLFLGIDKKIIDERIEDIKKLCELEDFFEQPLYSYSSGMRSRLGFAVAYYANPDVILIDEIIGVGDKSFRTKSTELMKERISSNKTVVIVSHNMTLIKQLCTRILVVDRKGVKEEMSVDDSIAFYNNSRSNFK